MSSYSGKPILLSVVYYVSQDPVATLYSTGQKWHCLKASPFNIFGAKELHELYILLPVVVFCNISEDVYTEYGALGILSSSEQHNEALTWIRKRYSITL